MSEQLLLPTRERVLHFFMTDKRQYESTTKHNNCRTKPRQTSIQAAANLKSTTCSLRILQPFPSSSSFPLGVGGHVEGPSQLEKRLRGWRTQSTWLRLLESILLLYAFWNKILLDAEQKKNRKLYIIKVGQMK